MRFAILSVFVAAFGGAAGAWYAWRQEDLLALRQARVAAAGDAEKEAVALRWLNEHLRKKPADIDANRLVAQLRERMGQHEVALKSLEKIPDFTMDDHLCAARCLLAVDRAGDAAAEAKASLKLGENAQARRILATALILLRNYEEALREARIAADDPKEGLLGLALVATVLRSQGEAASALEACEKYFNNPENEKLPAAARREMDRIYASTLIELDRNEEAAKRVKAWDDVDADSSALAIRGKLRLNLGEYKDAEKDLRKALEVQPPIPSAALDLAKLLIDARRPADAAQLLERWRSDLGGKRRFHLQLAAALERSGKTKESEAARKAAFLCTE